MLGIFSTVWVIGTGFWPLSGHGIGLFRATFVFKYFFYCGSSGQMRDWSSQLFQNYDIHVAGEIKMCFQTNTLKGINFIVNTPRWLTCSYVSLLQQFFKFHLQFIQLWSTHSIWNFGNWCNSMHQVDRKINISLRW